MSDPTDDTSAHEPDPPDDESPPKPKRGMSLEDLAWLGGEAKKQEEPAEPPKESEPGSSEGLIDRSLGVAAGMPIGLLQEEQVCRALAALEQAERDGLLGAEGLLKAKGFLNDPGGLSVPQIDTDAYEVARMMRHGGLDGVAGTLAELQDYTLEFDRTALIPNYLAEIVRGIDPFLRDASPFWEDVRLTRQLLADHDAAQALSSAETSAMSALLANLDSFADTTRRALDAYSITPETFGHMVGSLDQWQLDAITRQASSLLWEEIEQRGWTEIPSPRPRSATRADTPSTQPPVDEFEEVPVNASLQVEAFRRVRPVLEFLKSPLGKDLRMCFWAVVAGLIVGRCTADDDVHAGTRQPNVDSTVVVSEALNSIDSNPNAQAELVQQLREFCETLPDGPLLAPGTAGKPSEQPAEPVTAPSQALRDVQPDADVDTPRARPDDAVNGQPGVSADPSGRAREASSVDVQPDTADGAERAAERTPERRQSIATDPPEGAPDQP